MKKTDFAQSTLQVDGAPLRFTDRPYIYTIYNTDATEKLIMAGRQAEKSTTVAADMICESIAPHNKLLYVTPTMQQTGVFSRSKIDEMFLTSRKLRGALYEKMNSSVGEKRLKNYTTMYFRSAYHTADSIRGITSRRTYTDEVQDILSDILPVIDECSGHQPDAKFIRTGTPKTQDNTIEKKWGHSTQCEWMVKCEACNYWNTLTNTNIIHLDEPGLFCAKCGNRIYTNYGVWVSAHPDNFIKGFRLPQIILPEKYIDWGRLFHKMRTYPTAQLMNEVFGVSYDNAQKPITKEDLVKCCQEYEMDMKWKPQYTSRPVFIGIDWGTGDKSYSVLCAGVMTGKDKFKVIYLKKFIGTEADKDSMLRIIIDTVKSLRSPIIGVDWGFGY
ncbi:MAG: phage terminase large subunit family protein [Halobacteriota archaeon]|nr:phage terminase large subunit family protein [Halobacteriota archaeon]